MVNCLCELRCKEVVSVCNGRCLGCVDDLRIDVKCAKITALVIYGRPRFFGLFGKDEDIVIPWECVKVFGEDTVLVEFNCSQKRSKGFFCDFLKR